MKTVLDSSVILDVVTDDPKWGDASEAAIRTLMGKGALLVDACVLAEISPAFAEGDLEEFLQAWNIRFVPTTRETAMRAGSLYGAYLRRRGKAKRVLPDFLIGAFAMENGGRLLARDRGYYRDYFTGLTVINPVI
jgi:predicted nucleic acid-binding protein